MLAAEQYPYYDGAMLNHELLEVHRSKISVHRAKADYSYPMIRLPHTFSQLAGLRTRVYQTVHDGALAFLVVVGYRSAATQKSAEKTESATLDAKASVFARRVGRA
jgi:hypothetical protein